MKFISLLLFAAFSSLGWASQPSLSYSSPPNAAPFSIHKNDRIAGLCSELIQRFSNTQRLIPEPILVPWKRSFVLAEDGQLDLICGLYKTQQREVLLNYSSAFAQEDVSLFVTTDAPLSYQQWRDLKGLQGAATVGDSWGVQFDHFIAQNLDVMPVVTLQQGFKMLNAKRVDYVIATHYQGLQTLTSMSLQHSIKAHPIRLIEEKLYFAFNKASKHKHLLTDLNQWLDQADTRQFIKEYLIAYEKKLISNP